MRLAVVGLGTAGSWLLDAVERGEAGDVEVVVKTTGRDGNEGALAETAYDVLADAVNSPGSGEPGYGFMRPALESGAHVVTSDKWPVALHGVELAAIAAEARVQFRAESTVMSGTPVLAPLLEALGGARPVAARGVLNATVNKMLTDMSGGAAYGEALADAQAAGLAEPDPGADVDGADECAKAMVLAGLAFGAQLDRGAVGVRGISALTEAELEAIRTGRPVRSVSTVTRSADGKIEAHVAPAILDDDDPLADAVGVGNALLVTLDSGEELVYRGPGAGPEIAGKGMLDDLRALTR